MSNAPIAVADSSDGFLLRVLRWVAFICIAKGLLGMASATSEFLYYRYIYSPGNATMIAQADRGVRLLSAGLNILLAVAGIGLLRWRAWSRVILVVWALGTIAMSIANVSVSLGRYAEIQQRLNATSRPAGMVASSPSPSVAHLATLTILSAIGYWAFPMLVLCITMQPEIARLWAVRSGGFEVLPVAELTGETTPHD